MILRFIAPAILGVCAALIPSTGRANEPLGPPTKFSVTSADGAIRAVADPESATTTIENVATGERLWSIPGWHRWVFVAGDGKHAVTGYYGMNLIPQDYDENLVLFTFWREGKKIRETTLKEFFPSKNILQRTVSSFHWGGLKEIDAQGRLVVIRADGKVFLFDLDSGLQTK